MQERYRIYQRGGKNFYAKDTKTGRAFSLNTSDEREASRLLVAKNQATEQPCLNVAMARVYLSAQSPEFVSCTWGQLIELVAQGYEGATAVRWRKFASSAPLKILVTSPFAHSSGINSPARIPAHFPRSAIKASINEIASHSDDSTEPKRPWNPMRGSVVIETRPSSITLPAS